MGTAYGSIGVMFLGEVALGREHHVKHVDGSLTRTPDGYDSIVACERTEPGDYVCEFTCVCVCMFVCLCVHVCVYVCLRVCVCLACV